LVKNIVWSGEGAPEYPVFPLTKGLTSSAIAFGKTINVGDVAADPRYLTALGSTRSEIIVPVFDAKGKTVIGTIDVESDRENAFDAATQSWLELAAITLQPYWQE
jgi:putative methionine-R-sulfoxide reductase with GAF domain